MKKVFIKDLKPGTSVATVFLLKKKELGKTKKEKPYLKLEFADKTGSIEGRMWDNALDADGKVDTGAAVVVAGSVDEWNGAVQIKVDNLLFAKPGTYQHADLMRCVENIDEMYECIKSCLRKNISNNWISLLVKEFLDDQETMDKFKHAPGARSWHNAYIGGLMEHSLEVMVIVEKVCEMYPEANKDIALFGAFMHDIGKMYELDAHTFEYTHPGGLVGHLALGFELLIKKMASIDGFPDDLALHLKHIILSHHGEYEQQSPVLPKTLEAVIVYHADNLVSQANAVSEIMRAQSFAERDWSSFISIKNRKFFLKRPEE